jgi:hypothetical protein
MILLSSIINEFKDRFLDRYKNSVLPSHTRALQAMAQCRQESGPHMLAQCTDHNCGKQVYIPHSCGHRNCPHCQNHENWQWIENQLSKRLPTQYYLITFTLPQAAQGSCLEKSGNNLFPHVCLRPGSPENIYPKRQKARWRSWLYHHTPYPFKSP